MRIRSNGIHHAVAVALGALALAALPGLAGADGWDGEEQGQTGDLGAENSDDRIAGSENPDDLTTGSEDPDALDTGSEDSDRMLGGPRPAAPETASEPDALQAKRNLLRAERRAAAAEAAYSKMRTRDYPRGDARAEIVQEREAAAQALEQAKRAVAEAE